MPRAKKSHPPEIKSLYYITHVENVPSLLTRGILSHNMVEQQSVPYKRIYDQAIVSNRKEKLTPASRGLWDYANLYFQPRNPMLYRVVHECDKHNLAVIGVRPRVLQSVGAFVTDGNAANQPTQFFSPDIGLIHLAEQWPILQSEYWRSDDGSKRKIMSECLVPECVPKDMIHSVYVASPEAAAKIKASCDGRSIPIIQEPNMFFQPRRKWRVGSHIMLVQGDMFFSLAQTLTVSVNTVGIMGKGLASRAKYQFPDVYVVYQDACRSKRLTATKPFLYKREVSLDTELAEDSASLHTLNAVKWFLLFATKRHWRDQSRIEDIQAGLEWLQKNALTEGIGSLALPALGCGLGGLEWREVGPLMCRTLNSLQIPIVIYLPHEHQLSDEYLSQDYLLAAS